MRLRTLYVPGLIAGLLTLLSSGPPSYAEPYAETATVAAPDIAVRAGTHPGFDRVVFDWPRDTNYKISATDGKITIRFTAAGHARFNKDMFAYLTRASGFSSSTDAAGHLVVSFAIAPQAKIRDFTSDHSVVLDIEGNGAPAQPVILPETRQPQPAPVVAAQPPAQAAEARLPSPAATATAAMSQPVVSSTSDPTVDILDPAGTLKAHPAAEHPATAAPHPATAAPLSLKPDDAIAPPGDIKPVAKPPEKIAAVKASDKPMSVADPKPAAPATPPASNGISQGNPATAAPIAATVKDKINNSLTITDKPLLVLSLDPRLPTRAAIYERAGYAYILFDRKLGLDQAALTINQPPSLVTLEPMESRTSVYRFALPAETSVRATRDNTVWQIYLSKRRPDVPVSNNLIAQPDFALGARYILPLSDSPVPIHLTDPVVGDELIVIPLQQTEAFSIARRMADFQILPAAQGLVIRPLIDNLSVRAVSDGLEITGEGGLRLSSASDTGAALESPQKNKAEASGKSIFAFNAWRGHPHEDFTRTRQRLQQTVIDVPEGEHERARFELARFYFANGYGEEAVALLRMLAQEVPDLLAHPDFTALLGAAEILAYHADEGLRYLESPALNDQPEVALWRAVGHAELREWDSAAAQFNATSYLLEGYPEPFYSRFSILAIESLLAVGDDRNAAKILDSLEASPHNTDADTAILYLHGVMHAKAGRASAAEKAWKTVAVSRDRLYKIRAELALIDLGVSTKSLTPAQAADRLEALRFGWRGDDLEVDILRRLGEFYIQAHNIRAGINVLGQAVKLYPNSPMAPGIQAEMQKVFHDVFMDDKNKDLSPLDSLALYQQFRDLMPSGKEGDTVIRNLSERLVDVDLLDQSAALLDDMVRNRLQGEEKARTATRLAAIRLLDHKPDEALAALAYNDKDTLPADLQDERLLLRARALSEQHHDDQALALLHDNNQDAAKLLRADITMHAGRWQEAARALLDLIGPPPKPGESFRPEQSRWMLSCAIAYALASDQTGLDRLAIDYGTAMFGTPENDTFKVLTAADKSVQLQDINAARAKIDEVDLFQNFLNSYRKGKDTTDSLKVK